ncbi:MAG: MBL fold metallo-hydrolase, partial [Longimicrobiales bacterium]|nr:MBL fold metallo-hydrolase [Longimicrobiales bacterium]
MNRLFRLAALAVGLLAAPGVALGQEPAPESAPEPAPEQEPVRLVFLDVGQGDAVLIVSPEGRSALVDGGPSRGLVAKLRDLGIEALDLVVATHPHADHIGGLGEVVTQMPVAFYMDNGVPHTTQTYLRLMRALRERPEVTYLEASPRTIRLGSVEIEVLPLPQPGDNLNNRSVTLVVRHGDFEAFLSGDSEVPQLDFLLARGAVPDVELFKAPHHGSDDAVSPAFLRAASPEAIVISVGADNRFGHPRPAALAAYRSATGGRVHRTDLAGNVVVLGEEDGSFTVGGRAAIPGGAGGGGAVGGGVGVGVGAGVGAR